MLKYFSSFVIVLLLWQIDFCRGQQPDSLFTTPFVEPLAKDSISVDQAKARMQELKAKIAYYFPRDYSFHYVSYENERIIDRLKLSKTIYRGAKRGAIVGGCLSGIVLVWYWVYMSDVGALLIIPVGAIIGGLAGSAASALIYEENVGKREVANINNLITRYNAMAAQKVNKP